MAYIVFEGGEGSGKSTQAKIFANDINAVLTREPGATEIGSKIRSILLDPKSDLDPVTETLLMAADRSQNIKRIVKPALDSGKHVVSDRSVYSSLVYQGVARGLGRDFVQQINELAIGKLWPDLVILLDIDLAQANKRLNRQLDRFEQAGDDFHKKVLEGFRELAQFDKNRWVVLDATLPKNDLAHLVKSEISQRLGEL